MAGTVAQLLEDLGRSMPFGRAAPWDPVGLQIGDPHAPVERVAVCHEVTDAVVAELRRAPVELLISYHPLLFRPTTRLVAGSGPEGRALDLAAAGVALAVVHTSFDVAPGGAADALASALGLRDVRSFGPIDGEPSSKLVTFVPEAEADAILEAVVAAGGATIGNYTHCSYRTEGVGTFFAGDGTRPAVGLRGALNREPEIRLEFATPRSREDAVISALVAAHPYEEPAYDVFERRGELGHIGRVGVTPSGQTLGELTDRTASHLPADPVRVAGDPDRTLARVGVVPGSGEDAIAAARDAGADALVTGDVRHHAARRALESGLAIVDAGHVATERPGLRALLERVREVASGATSLLDLDPDPFGSAREPSSRQ